MLDEIALLRKKETKIAAVGEPVERWLGKRRRFRDLSRRFISHSWQAIAHRRKFISPREHEFNTFSRDLRPGDIYEVAWEVTKPAGMSLPDAR